MNSEDQIIANALEILASRVRKETITISSVATVKKYLIVRLAQEERELFGAIWLNVKKQIIDVEIFSIGTTSHTVVYPREVVKSALKHNADAVIYFHNHPTGNTTPSNADEKLTERLKSALELVDVESLDHIIVGGVNTSSFTELGLL